MHPLFHTCNKVNIYAALGVKSGVVAVGLELDLGFGLKLFMREMAAHVSPPPCFTFANGEGGIKVFVLDEEEVKVEGSNGAG
eukprot:15153595-Ditylum_brightwellii.AAC.1